MKTSFVGLLALVPALVAGHPHPRAFPSPSPSTINNPGPQGHGALKRDETESSSTSSGSALSLSLLSNDGAQATTTSDDSAISTGSPSANSSSVTGSASASASADTSLTSDSDSGTTSQSGLGATTAVATGSASASASASAAGTGTASGSAASPTSTNAAGPLYGADGKAGCDDLTSLSGSDWLVAGLCAISKCNHLWPASRIAVTDGGDDNASEVQVTIFDLEKNEHTTSVKYSDGATSKSDNNGTAWFGGAFDVAIYDMLTSASEAKSTFKENAGAYGLTYLTGMYSAIEANPANTDDLWPWIQKVAGTPVLVYTTSGSISLNANQYYSVNTYTGSSPSDAQVTLWNPVPKTGENPYITLKLDTLHNSIQSVHHLDWPHYIAKNATSTASSSDSNTSTSSSSSSASAGGSNGSASASASVENGSADVTTTTSSSDSDVSVTSASPTTTASFTLTITPRVDLIVDTTTSDIGSSSSSSISVSPTASS